MKRVNTYQAGEPIKIHLPKNISPKLLRWLNSRTNMSGAIIAVLELYVGGNINTSNLESGFIPSELFNKLINMEIVASKGAAISETGNKEELSTLKNQEEKIQTISETTIMASQKPNVNNIEENKNESNNNSNLSENVLTVKNRQFSKFRRTQAVSIGEDDIDNALLDKVNKNKVK